MSRPRNLSARDPIYGALRSASGPLTAYQILDAVRDQGITAPPTVYRALARLVDEGLAHRVESMNAYVACSHAQHGNEAAVLAICENCGSVSEIEATDALAGLTASAGGRRFRVDRMTVELRGLCGSCSDGTAGGGADQGHAHHHHGHDHSHD